MIYFWVTLIVIVVFTLLFLLIMVGGTSVPAPEFLPPMEESHEDFHESTGPAVFDPTSIR